MACIFYEVPYVFSQAVKRHDFNEYSAHIERTFLQEKAFIRRSGACGATDKSTGAKIKHTTTRLFRFSKKVKAQNQQHAVFTVKNANFEAR
mgnify:FL=1